MDEIQTETTPNISILPSAVDSSTPVTTYQLMGHRILFEPFDPDMKTPGGLHLVDSYQNGSQKGRVKQLGVAFDDKGVAIPYRVKVGDVISTSPHAGMGSEVKLDGKAYRVILPDDIWFVYGY